MNSTDNPLFKLTVWKIAIPVFIEFFLTFSFFFTDSIFVSRISDLAAGSVGATIPIFMIFVISFMMLAQAGSNVAGQYLGAIVINTFLGVVVALLLFFLAWPVGRLLSLQGEALSIAGTYLKYISIALLLIAIKTGYTSVTTSQGKTIWNMYNAFLGNVVNIILNLAFLLQWFNLPKIGLMGVIISTILSQVVSVIFIMCVVHFRFRLRFHWKRFSQRFAEYRKPILAIGLPSLLEPISAELGMLMISVFTVRLGDTAMAARIYTMSLITLSICWASAIAIGNQVLVAYRVGAGMFSEANRMLVSNIRKGVTGNLSIAILLFVFSIPLMKLFTTNDIIIELGTGILFLAILIEPVRAVSTITSYSLKAAGDARVSTYIGLGATWLVAIPSAYFIGIIMGYGVVGLWIGLLIDEILRASVNYWRWSTGKWVNYRLV
jgi:putative MATE family efflux protein